MQHPPESCPIPGATGCVRAWGPPDADILFVGEAAGKWEAIKGIPFIGDSGTQLDRLLRFIRRDRNACRIVNVKACHPPGDWLVGAPWEHFHCSFCERQLAAALNEPHKVVIPLGATALRKIMRLPKVKGKEGGQLANWHGSPVREPGDKFWVVPTYHPSFLLQGGQKYTKTVCFDLQVAFDLADGSWQFDMPELVIDPPIDWFTRWVDEYLTVQDEVWLDFDVETPDKGKKTDEGELSGEDASYQILFINFAMRPDQGVTVPWVEPYITQAKRAMASRGVKVAHNRHYDVPRMKKAGVTINGVIYDTLDMFHVLHPALPRGLGFIAPFYAKIGPYKHLGNLNGTYRALDGVVGLKVAYGVAADLQSRGQWDVYWKACHQRDTLSLEPATEVGLPINWERLEKEFIPSLKKAVEEADRKLAEIVPEEVKPLDGPYVKRPVYDPGKEYENGWKGEVIEKAEGEVKVCKTCGQEKVQARHKCKGYICTACKTTFARRPRRTKREGVDSVRIECCTTQSISLLTPDIRATPIGSVRFYKKLPFNPGSWVQVLTYIKFRGHKPGKAKKSKKESSDKKALQRLVKTGDPFYATLLDRRQADKMKGTYGDGLVQRKGADGRVHGHFGHLPWTFRINSTDPNMTNLADHVKYAAEFKRCIEACDG